MPLIFRGIEPGALFAEPVREARFVLAVVEVPNERNAFEGDVDGREIADPGIAGAVFADAIIAHRSSFPSSGSRRLGRTCRWGRCAVWRASGAWSARCRSSGRN